LRKGKIKRKETEVKNTEKMGGNLKNGMKRSLWSFYYSKYKLSIPRVLKILF
jgi:hypothetical protein